MAVKKNIHHPNFVKAAPYPKAGDVAKAAMGQPKPVPVADMTEAEVWKELEAKIATMSKSEMEVTIEFVKACRAKMKANETARLANTDQALALFGNQLAKLGS